MEYHTLTAMNGQDDDIDPLSPQSMKGGAVSFMASRAANVLTNVITDWRESNSSSVQIVDSPHQSEVEIIKVECDVGSKSALIKECSRHTAKPLFRKSNQSTTNSNFRTKKFPLCDSDDIYSKILKLRKQPNYFTIKYKVPINREVSVKNDAQYLLSSPSEYLNSPTRSPDNIAPPSPQLQSSPQKKHELFSSPQLSDAETIAEISEREPSELSEHSSTDEWEYEKKENAFANLKYSTATSPPPFSSYDDRSDDSTSETIVERLPREADASDPEIGDDDESYVRLNLLSMPELNSAEAGDVTRILSNAFIRDSIHNTVKDIASESFLDDVDGDTSEEELCSSVLTHSMSITFNDNDLIADEAITCILDNDTNDNIGDDISVTDEEIHSDYPQHETNDHSIFNNVSILSISL